MGCRRESYRCLAVFSPSLKAIAQKIAIFVPSCAAAAFPCCDIQNTKASTHERPERRKNCMRHKFSALFKEMLRHCATVNSNPNPGQDLMAWDKFTLVIHTNAKYSSACIVCTKIFESINKIKY